MNSLHKNSRSEGHIDSKEGRRGFLCNSSSPLRRPFLDTREVQAYTELGLILKRIHKRVVAEKGPEYFEQYKNGHLKNTT